MMARQAQWESYPEIAEVLKFIAPDKARHAVSDAELNGKINPSTKENAEKMLSSERSANKGKREMALKAKEAGVDEAHDFFDESLRGKARHVKVLEGLNKRCPDKI